MKRRSKKPWVSVPKGLDGDHYDFDDFVFDTYAELKKNLIHLINKSYTYQVNVIRTRRGEWGQWFEVWELSEVDGKPIKIKQTWL